MAKTLKSKTGQYRITIPASIMTVFNLEDGVEYERISVQGLSIKGTKIILCFTSSLKNNH
jgi:bifunctional DNA-binding transcriptional regulator/antitoxin component of YhaV-PrlF toxin-antitoxin module